MVPVTAVLERTARVAVDEPIRSKLEVRHDSCVATRFYFLSAFFCLQEKSWGFFCLKEIVKLREMICLHVVSSNYGSCWCGVRAKIVRGRQMAV